MTQRYICVFAGSSSGRQEVYAQAAYHLGQVIAQKGYGVVYGGASVGLMNQVAEGALSQAAPVVGILPEWLERWEVAHHGLTELRIVSSMHERKAQMAELASAFVVLPGGIGSLEECFEVWTWTQLGIHKKAIGLLNINGYYDRLTQFLDHVVAEEFLKPGHRAMLECEADAATLIEKLIQQTFPSEGKWIDKT